MFVLCDIETSGIDENRDVILEVGIVVADDDLNEIANKSWLIYHDDLPSIRENCRQIAREMHDKTGLWRACLEGEPVSDVESEAIAFLQRYAATGYPMTGNSIHFDRRFLRRYMPSLDKAFYRRSIDVSTLTELARFWRPEVYTNRPHAEDKDKPHRAYLDIQHSIAQLKYFRQEFLR